MMMHFLKHLLRNLFTGRNNIDYSLTKLMGIVAGSVMIYKFYMVGTPDFMSFGTGFGAIMAALAAKYYVEGEKADQQYMEYGSTVLPTSLSLLRPKGDDDAAN